MSNYQVSTAKYCCGITKYCQTNERKNDCYQNNNFEIQKELAARTDSE